MAGVGAAVKKVFNSAERGEVFKTNSRNFERVDIK